MYTVDGDGGGGLTSAAEKSFEKFMLETSGGFHATDDDWTTVGRDKDGFPVPKGSPEDVSTPAAVDGATAHPQAVVLPQAKAPAIIGDPNTNRAVRTTDISGAPVATSATATGATPGATMMALAKVNQTPDEAAKEAGGEVTTMHFPHRVILTVRHGHTIDFPAGANPVPNSLVGHYYLKANRVSTNPLYATAKPGAATQPGGDDLTLEQAKAIVAKLEAKQMAAGAGK